MPKRVALKDSVEVDSVDLSNFARSVRLTSEHTREDVSGFSATTLAVSQAKRFAAWA